MKKLAIVICLLFVAAIGSANNYTVTVSTHNPATEIGQTDGSYPDISGGARIQQIILTNSGATVQTITLYELSGSSTTANAIATVVLETTGTVIVPYTQAERVSGLGIKKSATGSTVNASVQYK